MALTNYAGDLSKPSLPEYQVTRHIVMPSVTKDSAKRHSTRGFQSAVLARRSEYKSHRSTTRPGGPASEKLGNSSEFFDQSSVITSVIRIRIYYFLYVEFCLINLHTFFIISASNFSLHLHCRIHQINFV